MCPVFDPLRENHSNLVNQRETGSTYSFMHYYRPHDGFEESSGVNTLPML